MKYFSPDSWVKSSTFLAWESGRHFATPLLVSPRNGVWETKAQISNWLCRERNLLQPVRSTTQVWVLTRHQYGILGLLLGRHFAGTPEEESWKAGCFVRCANLTKQPAFQVSRDANRFKWRQPHLNLHSTQPVTGSSADLVLLWI